MLLSSDLFNYDPSQSCILLLIVGKFLPQFQGRLTYGKIGEWRFDKRSFGSVPPPRNLPLPPPGVAQSVVSLKCILLCHICKAKREHLYKYESETIVILSGSRKIYPMR